MKRILYIHHGGGIGGAPLSLLYLLQQLDRSRYEPVVVTLKPGPVVDLYRAEGIETHVEPGISDFSHTTLEWYGGREWWRLPGKFLHIWPSIRRARRLIRRLQPDIVHLNSSTLATSAIACKLEGVPVVWHIREPLAPGYTGLRRWFIRQTIHRCADRVVAICQNDADQLITSDHIQVIFNFVDFNRFDRSLTGETIRRELDIPADAPVVTMLGGIAEPKGTLILIRALPYLLEAVPAARVIIAGPPPRPLDEKDLKGFAKRLLRVDAYQRAVQQALRQLDAKYRGALIFTGIRKDMPEVIAAGNCVVFPSVVPHFARPVIEAAAMAKPAVASDLGGPRELIVSGETGLLVAPHDPAALADGLVSLLTDRARSQQMGEAAYHRARELFDAQRNAAKTVFVYNGL
jgi:glycosyltransferase involved in cell wall biosynthesis